MPGETHTLADFAAGLQYELLDSSLVAKFKTYLLDAVGCALHGTSQPWARIIDTVGRLEKLPSIRIPQDLLV